MQHLNKLQDEKKNKKTENESKSDEKFPESAVRSEKRKIGRNIAKKKKKLRCNGRGGQKEEETNAAHLLHE